MHLSVFTVGKLENALRKTKLGKSAGFDGIYPELLIYTGPGKWLFQFHTDLITTSNLPKMFKKAKVIALLKPGKDRSEAVSLLIITSKTLERLVLELVLQSPMKNFTS